ncbi:stage V sporulation protein K [Bacillus fonticola]|uniref:stage V sporulation protein K n=1 Tax=Bacillus fonticola TaxID=2728853 RepID=UPI0014736646|nr:stage V sporulation protein K [Bacillus fonticola]
MDQPIRLKNNGQINIVLNSQKRHAYPKEGERGTLTQKQRKQATTEELDALQALERELDQLVGLSEMKKIMKEIYAWIVINKKRQEAGLKPGKQALHMLFKGNPGTGKTTVARLIGTLLQRMEVLSKGHLIEAERADLVGEYIGHTAQKTRDLVKKSLGGILFIDEAYSLGRGGEKDFGKEAIDTLVKHMEDKHQEFVLILAGYKEEMDHFLTLNPGLYSRFPIVIDFPDYTTKELMEIAQTMLDDKEYVFSQEATRQFQAHLENVQSRESNNHFSNGRYVRNVLEKSIRAHSMRLLTEQEFDRAELMTLRSLDLKM